MTSDTENNALDMPKRAVRANKLKRQSQHNVIVRASNNRIEDAFRATKIKSL